MSEAELVRVRHRKWPRKVAAGSAVLTAILVILGVIILFQPAFFAEELIFIELGYRIAIVVMAVLGFALSLVIRHHRVGPVGFRTGALALFALYGVGYWLFYTEALERRDALMLYYRLDQKSRLDGGQIGIIGKSDLPKLDLDPLFTFVRIRRSELKDDERILPQTLVGTRSEWSDYDSVAEKRGYRKDDDFSLGWTTYRTYTKQPGKPRNMGIVRPGVIPEALRFLVFADSGHPSEHLYSIVAQTLTRDATSPYSALLLLGDNIYLNSVPMVQLAFDAAIRKPFAPITERGIPIYALLGNHDYNSPIIYSEQLHDPLLNMNGFNYYDVTFGNNLVTFYVVDTERLETDMLQTYWLRRRLKDCDSRWKIVLMHVPAEGSDVGHGGDLGLRTVLEAADVPRRAHLVMAGHNHIYERRRGNGRLLNITCGGTGEVSDYDLPPDPNRMVGYTKENFFTELDITKDEIRIRATNEDGELIDDVTVFDQGDWKDTPGAVRTANGVVLAK